MNKNQEKLYELILKNQLEGLTLKEIADLVDLSSPQSAKYHLDLLEEKGFIVSDSERKRYVAINQILNTKKANNKIFTIPFLGYANCGEAVSFADEKIEDYISVSSTILDKKNPKDLFIVKAIGLSMNRANINGKPINHGDYVIVDRANLSPKNGDYVLSIINEAANIKRFYKDKSYIKLLSESTTGSHPIFIHKNDDYIINGVVVDVL